jgi:hypothetical protein
VIPSTSSVLVSSKLKNVYQACDCNQLVHVLARLGACKYLNYQQLPVYVIPPVLTVKGTGTRRAIRVGGAPFEFADELSDVDPSYSP